MTWGWTEDTGCLMASHTEDVKLGDPHPLLRPPMPNKGHHVQHLIGVETPWDMVGE